MFLCFAFFVLHRSDLIAVPMPKGHADQPFTTYLHAQLLHLGGDLEWRSQKVKAQPNSDNSSDVCWQSQVEWEYDVDDMAFLR